MRSKFVFIILILFMLLMSACDIQTVLMSVILNGPLNNVVIDTDSVTLSWSITEDGNSYTYNIYFGENVNPPLFEEGFAGLSYVVPSLKQGTDYYWAIEAESDYGRLKKSAVYTFRTSAVQKKNAECVLPLDEADDTALDAQLRWQGFPGGETNVDYVVYMGDSVSTLSAVATVTDVMNYIPADVFESNKSYFWRVDTHLSDEVLVSDVWEFKTTQTPRAPELITPVFQSVLPGDSVLFSWDVLKSQNEEVMFDLLLGSTDTNLVYVGEDLETQSYTLADMNLDTRYYWKVMADYDNGGSCESEVWSFTTPNTGAEVSNILPVDKANYIPSEGSLEWRYSGNLDNVLFNVYLGTSTNPPLYQSDVQTDYLNYSGLNQETTYYWKIEARNVSQSVFGPVYTFTTKRAGNYPPEKAFNPYPRYDTQSVSTNITLGWTGKDNDNDPLTYNVYVGSSLLSLILNGSDLTTNYYELNDLGYGRNYYWRVDVNDGKSVTTGDVWRFRTESAPAVDDPTVENLSPANNSQGLEGSVTLSWDGANANVYDLYFGETTSPPLYANTSSESYTISVTNGKKYYWQVVAKNGSKSFYGPIWTFSTVFNANQADEAAREMISYVRNTPFVSATSFSETTNWGSVTFNSEYYDSTSVSDLFQALRVTFAAHQDIFFPLELRAVGPEIGTNLLVGRYEDISVIDALIQEEAVKSITLRKLIEQVDRLKFFFSGQWYNIEVH